MEHLEGRQSVLAALSAYQRKFQVILISQGLHHEKIADVLEAAALRNVPVQRVERAALDAMAHGASHGGVLAVVSGKPKTSFGQLNELLDRLDHPPLLLLIEGIDDARNLGFTLRSSAALGVDALLIKKHVWDFDPVEVARPASGAYETLPLVQLDSAEPLTGLQRRGLKLFGCVAGARRTIYQADLKQPIILAIGGEKRGLSGAVRDICDRFVTIPNVSGAPSLALSHAAAIVAAEAMRQRSILTGPGG